MEHPPTSIDTEPEINLMNQHLYHSEVLLSLHNKNISQFYYQVTQLLYISNPRRRRQNSPNKEDIPQTNKVTQDFEADNRQDKTCKQNGNTDDSWA